MIANKIDHIGIAVSDLDEAIKRYSEVLGIRPEEIQRYAVPGLNIVIFPIGESKIELLQSTDPNHPLARFIAEHGEGLHHLAVGVRDIKGEMETLKKKGVPLADREPRAGLGGQRIAFLDQKALNISLELAEEEP